MNTRRLLMVGFLALGGLALAFPPAQDGERLLDPGYHHLGDDPTPEWPEASLDPEGQRLDFTFRARANPGEHVLIIGQRNVNNAWYVELNGRRIATLKTGDELADHAYPVPAGTLVDGDNTFALVGDVPTDDITVGNIRLFEKSFRELYDLRPTTITVTDVATGAGVPVRITIADDNDVLVPVYYAQSEQTAVREGVVYTLTGTAVVELPRGSYRVYATHGPEWGLGRGTLAVGDEGSSLALSIGREVDTTGYVAADTHIHTLTFSGHGDSSVEERMITLVAEGVELAISTDHNHNTDYRPYQERMGLNAHFTPAVGNEVTTSIGHLNAFPLGPDDPVPDHALTDMVKLVENIRSRGAEVVILNHPRWPEHETGPFGTMGLDHFTGDARVPSQHPYDAMELINSCTREEAPTLLFEDWFALLNRGESVRAVGSSDSHTVGNPVGGGRTYVPSASDDPARIDVSASARHIAEGRCSISMGIFVDVQVDGEHGMGDLVPVADGQVAVTLHLAAPAWVEPRRAALFVNGEELWGLDLARDRDGPLDLTVPIPLALEASHDAWLVCVVHGAPIAGPWWPLTNDYTLGATNPVFLDVDGDGSYSSPRDTARAIVARAGTTAERVQASLANADEAVALQVLNLVRQDYLRQAHERLRDTGTRAAAAHPVLLEYLDSLEAPD